MTKKVVLFSLLALLLGAIVWPWGPTIQARDPHAVDLMYFIGEGIAEGVQLDWRTATEYDTAAFRMKRASSESGPFVYIDVWQNGVQLSVIPLQNPDFPETGGIYSVEDLAAAIGQTYWYTLVEIEMDGTEIELETISLVAGVNVTATFTPTATATGQVVGGGNNGSNTATSTPTATATQSAAATATLPQSTSVPATATPRPTTNIPTPLATSTPPATDNPDPSSGDNGDSRGSTDAGGSGASTGGTGGGGANTQPIAQVTSAPAQGYPGAGGESSNTALAQETPAPTDAAYPEGQPTVAVDPDATPYPQEQLTTTVDEAYQGSSPGVTEFGNEPGVAPDSTLPAPVQNSTTTSSTRGRVVLWVGFLGGLLIFAAGVFGTILLFTRKQNGPQ